MSILSGKEVSHFSRHSLEYCAGLRKRCFAGAAIRGVTFGQRHLADDGAT
jgi:hypothetical protein